MLLGAAGRYNGMKEIMYFINTHKAFTASMLGINILLNNMLIRKIFFKTNKIIIEAKGRRLTENSLYQKCTGTVSKYVGDYERRYGKTGFYKWGKRRVKRAGFEGEFAVAKYLFLQACFPLMLFIFAFITNFPSFKEAVIVLILACIVIEIIIGRRKRKLELKLQNYGYKIYKYLHNQIASGIKVTDAIKTVYEVIEDRDLKKVLLRMSARYELTLDIDAALDEFRSVCDSQEGESFCIAVKQGILTGDNRSLLAKQEDIMFKKHFNYIQVETDALKTKSIVAAVVFTAIIVMMILVPFLFESADAVGKIFSG